MSGLYCIICEEELHGDCIYLCLGGDSVCYNCVHVRRVQRCPVCKRGISDIRNNNLENVIAEFKSLQKALNDLGMIECCYKEDGCNERMRIESVQEHQKRCPKRKVHCSFANEGCTTVSSKTGIKSHELTCSFRKVLCVHGCTEGIPITEVTKHDSSCPNGSYPCRFEKNGCIATMKFCELQDHEVQCEYRTVQCTYAELGCGTFAGQDKIVEHETICPYRATRCCFWEKGCETVLLLNERYEHESTCTFRRISCYFAKNGCSEVGLVVDIKNHTITCKYRTVMCAFQQQGCGVVMKYPEIRKHESVCPFRWTNCLFSTNGCTAKVLIDEIEAHESRCQFTTTRIKVTLFDDAPLRCGECKILLTSEVFSVKCKTLAYCEKCSQKYSKLVVTRNKSCENLIEIIRSRFYLPCMYSENGCEENFHLNDKGAHEANCLFRNECCKYPNCTWQGTIELVIRHMSSHYGMQVMAYKKNKFYSNNFTENIENLEERVIMLQAAEEVFKCTLRKENDLIYWIVQLLGETNVANKYQYKLKLVSGCQELVCHGKCGSDSQDKEELIKEGKYVWLLRETLIDENFVKDGILEFFIEIMSE